MRKRLGLALTYALMLFSGCEKIDEGYNPSGGNLPTNYIVIFDGSFSPSSLTLVGGNSVTFLNSSSGSHQIISADSTTINTGLLAPQAYYYWKKDITGTYPFHCSLHPAEQGVLVLTP
jgi:hypothetical protein